MVNNDKNFYETDDEYKAVMQDNLQALYSCINDTLMTTTKSLNSININFELPNVGITLNNKIDELSDRFQKCGLSFYSKVFTSTESPDKTIVTQSTIGTAIYSDLLSFVNNAELELKKCSSNIVDINNRKQEKITALEQLTPFKKFLYSIRSRFITKNSSVKDYTQEELDSIKSNISTYIGLNSNLENYTLENGLVSSISKYLNSINYPIIGISDLLSSDIEPDLNMLELSNLIPELRNSLLNQINAKDFIIKKKINHEKAIESAEEKLKESEIRFKNDDFNEIEKI